MVVGGGVVAPKPPGGEFPNHRPGNKVSFLSNNNASVWLRACQKLVCSVIWKWIVLFLTHKATLMV